MSNRHDDVFDSLHDEPLSALYRETCTAEPSKALDQPILAAARIAAASHSTPTTDRSQRHSARHWTLPLALAATVVLAVGLLRVVPAIKEIGDISAALEGKAARSQPKQDTLPAKNAVPTVAEPTSQAQRAAPVRTQPAASAIGTVHRSSQPALATPDTSVPEPGLRESRLRAATPAEQDIATPPLPAQATLRPATDWLAEIAELRRQGRMTEAEARLREFRKHYPDIPLDSATKPVP